MNHPTHAKNENKKSFSHPRDLETRLPRVRRVLQDLIHTKKGQSNYYGNHIVDKYVKFKVMQKILRQNRPNIMITVYPESFHVIESKDTEETSALVRQDKIRRIQSFKGGCKNLTGSFQSNLCISN